MKLLISITMLAFFSVLSCGGSDTDSDSNNNNNQNQAEAPVQVKVIALTGSYAVYLSNLAAYKRAFTEEIAPKWSAGTLESSGSFADKTYPDFGNTDDLVSGSLSWSASSASLPLTLTMPSSSPLEHQSVLVDYPGNDNLAGATITLDGVEYTTNVSTTGSNLLEGTLYGTIDYIDDGGGNAATEGADISASSSVEGLAVSIISPEAYEGTVSLTSSGTAITGNEVIGVDVNLTSPSMTLSVTYNGTTYTCTTDTAYLASLMGEFTANSVSCANSP